MCLGFEGWIGGGRGYMSFAREKMSGEVKRRDMFWCVDGDVFGF